MPKRQALPIQCTCRRIGQLHYVKTTTKGCNPSTVYSCMYIMCAAQYIYAPCTFHVKMGRES